MSGPLTPSERRKKIEGIDSRVVYRDGLSQDSYEKLENANGVEEIREVLLDIFEPSGEE